MTEYNAEGYMMITPENYCIVAVLNSKKSRLEPHQKIKWIRLGSGEVPTIADKGAFELYCEKAWRRVSQVGLSMKLKRRVK